MFLARLRRFWPALLLVLALAVTGGALLLQARRAAAQPPVYRLSVGQKLTYALGYDNTINANFAGLMPAPNGKNAAPENGLQQTVTSRLSGKWIAIVATQTPNERVLACHLEDAQLALSSGGNALDDEADAVESDLARPFWVRLTVQGAVTDVRFDAQTSETARGFARALLGLWQFVTPADATDKAAKSWETAESDTAGRYIARYAFAPNAATATATGATATDATATGEAATGEAATDDDAARADAGIARAGGALFSKTKVRYLPAGAATATQAAPANEVASDTHLLARFDAGALEALRGWEKQTITLAGQQVADSHTNVAFRLTTREDLDATTLQSLQADNARSAQSGGAVALFEAPDADEMRQATRQSTLGEDSLGSLLSQLAQAQKAGQTENVALYVKFRALAEVAPDSCAILGQLLEVAPPRSLTFRVVSEALSAAKSEAAQAALVSVTRKRRGDADALETLIPALGLSALPSQGAQDVLSELARSTTDAGIASTAQLALGSLARSLLPSAPARSAQIVDELTRQLRNARSNAQKQQLLLTLGNTGSPRALPSLQDYAANPDVALRATALNSLRFVTGAAAEKSLLRALAADPSAEVRLQAAQALSFRAPSDAAFAAQKTALLNDADKNVRLAVLNALWRADFRSSETRTLVAQIAQTDPSSDVKKAAAQLLAPRPLGD